MIHCIYLNCELKFAYIGGLNCFQYKNIVFVDDTHFVIVDYNYICLHSITDVTTISIYFLFF